MPRSVWARSGWASAAFLWSTWLRLSLKSWPKRLLLKRGGERSALRLPFFARKITRPTACATSTGVDDICPMLFCLLLLPPCTRAEPTSETPRPSLFRRAAPALRSSGGRFTRDYPRSRSAPASLPRLRSHLYSRPLSGVAQSITSGRHSRTLIHVPDFYLPAPIPKCSALWHGGSVRPSRIVRHPP